MTLAERFPTLARHTAVLRESWRAQNAADAARRPRTDTEFLPAVLEITETPPSPGARFLLLSLCALFAIALAWSVFGRVDVTAVASGKVVPAGNVKIIQPIEIGAVRAIRVANGQRVRAGQILVELDPTLAGAEGAQAAQTLLTQQITAARNTALLAHADGRRAVFAPPPGTPADVAATQRAYVREAIAEYEGERASLLQQRAEKAAELAAAQAEIAKLETTAPLVDRQLDARRQLADKGFYSKLKVMEYEQLRLEHGQNIAVQRAAAAKARAAIAHLDAELRRLRGTFGRTAVSAVSESQERSGLARGEVTKAEQRSRFQLLRSPVNGTVQQLAVNTVGGVVQPAQALMVIVPDDAAVVVEAQVLNRDIGFVRPGQTVRVKLEAYPFTDYGVVPGVVESISRDAVDLGAKAENAQRGEAARAQAAGLVYLARIRLLRNTIRVNGQNQPIGPGLAVQAEIKTDERRIIQYLLSPLARTADEAGRER